MVSGDFFQEVDNCELEAGTYSISVDKFASKANTITVVTHSTYIPGAIFSNNWYVLPGDLFDVNEIDPAMISEENTTEEE